MYVILDSSLCQLLSHMSSWGALHKANFSYKRFFSQASKHIILNGTKHKLYKLKIPAPPKGLLLDGKYIFRGVYKPPELGGAGSDI